MFLWVKIAGECFFFTFCFLFWRLCLGFHLLGFVFSLVFHRLFCGFHCLFDQTFFVVGYFGDGGGILDVDVGRLLGSGRDGRAVWC